MKPEPPAQDVSTHRKALHYVGLALCILGFVLFLSTFVTFAMNFGNFENFVGNAQSTILCAVAGMVCMIVGGAMMGVGTRGLAGSGMMLDPQRARGELEPLARLSGRLTDTAFSEMKTVRESLQNLGTSEAREVVKVRCRHCQQLSDESDKFCGNCGAAL